MESQRAIDMKAREDASCEVAILEDTVSRLTKQNEKLEAHVKSEMKRPTLSLNLSLMGGSPKKGNGTCAKVDF